MLLSCVCVLNDIFYDCLYYNVYMHSFLNKQINKKVKRLAGKNVSEMTFCVERSVKPNSHIFETKILITTDYTTKFYAMINTNKYTSYSYSPSYSPNKSKMTNCRNFNKNSSRDEIANVNFLRRCGTYVLQNTKKANLLRLTN